MASTNPDEYAWRLFLYLNRQAQHGVAGVADPRKKSITDYDSDTETNSYPVVWETWALASGTDSTSNESEVFRKPATEPVKWEHLVRPNAVKRNLQAAHDMDSKIDGSSFLVLGARMKSCFDGPFDGAGIGVDETLMNREIYEIIRENELYSVEGLEKAYKKAHKDGKDLIVDFPRRAKEIKARWIVIKPTEKDRYHYRIVNKQYYGLSALHIITRDLDNWFWCDFDHVDNESLPFKIATNRLKDSTTLVTNGVRPETQGDRCHQKWSNYRLRGTQIDYKDANGQPTILANPRLEANFQSSSCIGCHALASVGLTADHPEHRLSKIAGEFGAAFIPFDPCQVTEPMPSQFIVSGQENKPFIKVGFVWAIPFRAFRACDKAPPRP